jgi:hypothetical protein
MLNMSLSGTDTDPSAALEWILVYSPADFSSASVAAGPTAIAASKFVSCSYAPGISKCVLWGINATGLSNGVVATVSLTLSTSTTNTSSGVQFALAEAADAVGTSLAASGSGGIVTIPQTPGLNGFSCSPASITPPGSSSCRVTLTAPAPASGATITLSSSPAGANLPPTLTIPQGATASTFNITAGTVSVPTPVILTASYLGVSETFGVTINPPTNNTAGIAVFGTGLVSAGALAADASPDPHYTIIASADASAPGPNAYVVYSNALPIGSWIYDGPNSKWIAPRTDAGNGNAAGNYTYRTTFDLTGFNASTAVLTGQFVADNSATIKLNGVTVGPSSFGFLSWTPFTITSGFVAGVNTLDFVVTNDGSSSNPTGLRVDLSGSATPSVAPPITVTVSPPTVTLLPGQFQPFTATVGGTSNQAVAWSISPATFGSISTSGLYLAPSNIASQQTVTVMARSLADNTATGSATVTLSPSSSTGLIAIFNTGVVSAGTLAADGAVDSHYTIIASADVSGPGPNAYAVNSNALPIGSWISNGPNSKWIAPRVDAGNGNAPGTYTYRTTFDLTAFNPATAVLTGQFAADNSAIVKLNGVAVGISSPGFTTFTPFTIRTGFVAGLNTLDFVVTNDGSFANPTGLRVEISGSATVRLTPPSSTGTIAIFNTGVVSAGTLAADAAVDSHYTIIASADASAPGPNAYVVYSNASPIGSWMYDGPNSKWISPRADAGNSNAPGTYIYRTSFDLTGFNPATAVLTGQFAADNSAILKLNGVAVGISSSGFAAFTPFTISTGFVAGLNTLDFVVTNDPPTPNPPNSTGLRVEVSASASR